MPIYTRLTTKAAALAILLALLSPQAMAQINVNSRAVYAQFKEMHYVAGFGGFCTFICIYDEVSDTSTASRWAECLEEHHAYCAANPYCKAVTIVAAISSMPNVQIPTSLPCP